MENIISGNSKSGQLAPGARQPARAGLAAFVGTMIEWYDFYIYGTAAALVFGQLFFPPGDPFLSRMAALGTFAVGFFARPLGGIVFGHLGDRLGRKKSLVITLMLMGIATVCIGLLPTYQQIGLWAPVALVALRVLQGVAVGGEWGGAVLIAGEHAGRQRRTLFASFAQLGSPAGLILSLLAFKWVTAMEPQAMLDYGWRLPFLASAGLLLIGLLIRLGVNESPEFETSRQQRAASAAPLLEVVRKAWPLLLLCIGANTIGIAGVYFTNTFMIVFTTEYLGLAKPAILACLFYVAFIQFAIQPLAAWLGQRFGAARFLKIAAALAILSPYPMFVLVKQGAASGNAWLMVMGIAICVICMASFYSVIAGFVSGIFETRVRYTAISLSYQVCGAIAGGLTPLIGTMLAQRYHGEWWPLAIFYSLMSAVSLLSVVALDRLRHLHADQA
ncbi:MHS family MFS transporter [Chromobacterium sp. S0633]|uniref:MFS transporter n=1 Tax=Chromobacterium sp. S0633 TaxID=2957805 RepID=UPI0020A04E89|nr:MFS transporter [Chromobacterium sp. S0633]MCP1291390.1 MHS family MFS transporter [Chromobacterium sp. S0633]